MSEIYLEWQKAGYTIRQGFLMRSVKIIDSLSLKITKGSSIGLIGPNGAGKTTTLKLGAGLISPGSGSVRIKGVPADHPSARACIGLLTENQYVYPHLKLREWLRMLGALSGIPAERIEKAMQKVLVLFELEDKSECLLNTLSKGQIQRAGFSQAFLHDPEILILDEPMSGMDPLWRSRILDILMAYKTKGGTILFSSHIMSDVLRLSDRIVVINQGALTWEGNMNDLPGSDNRYSVVFQTLDPQKIKINFQKNNMEQQPDGSFLMEILSNERQRLLELAARGDLTLCSFNPQYGRLEEMFQ